MSNKKRKQPKPMKIEKPDCELTTEDIAEYLSRVHFRGKIFGGSDSYDVWKKIKRVDEMYSHVLDNQRLKYEALIEEREQWYRVAFEKCRRYESKYGPLESDEAVAAPENGDADE